MDNTRAYARVSHSRQWSNYNITPPWDDYGSGWRAASAVQSHGTALSRSHTGTADHWSVSVDGKSSSVSESIPDRSPHSGTASVIRRPRHVPPAGVTSASTVA